MKHVLIALMVAFTFSTLVWGQQKDTIAYKKVGVRISTDLGSNGSKTTMQIDSVSGLEYTDVVDSTRTGDSEDLIFNGSDEFSEVFKELGITKDTINGGIIVALISVLLIFGLPIVVIICVFYFRYKNRKAKYQLMQQALASGQSIPEGTLREDFKETFDENKRVDGIKQTFLGLGLFIFLWAITGTFGVGCVGLLVMFIGIGKWVTSIDKNRRDEKK